MKLIKFKDLKTILIKSVKSWNDADPFRQSATISYYAIFSIPGLLIIVIWAAGIFFGEEAIRGEVSNQLGGIMGEETAQSVEGILEESAVDDSNIFMKLIGIGALLYGATTLFFQLQKTLNYLWDVEAVPDNNIKKLIVDRASSLGLILVLAFLLLMTLILSSMISVVSDWITGSFGDGIYILVEGVNFVVAFAIVTLLFAIMFKVLPDVQIQWKSVWVGAMVTSLLFSIGKSALGFYFGVSDPTSGFGAAGTIILVMLWVNYTCLILFFGAEFTKVYAHHFGHPIKPSKHAKWSAAYQLNQTNAEKEPMP